MKTSTFVLVGAAALVGGFGALQADHYLAAHRSVATAVAFRESSATGTPAVFAPASGSTVAAGAPFDFAAAAKKANPSVVSIDQYRNMAQGDFWGNRGPSVEREVGQGSGVILSADGYLVTNNHVVEGGSRFVVHLSDGRTLQAKLVGEPDPRSDLAVLKVEGKGLTPIELAPEGSVQVGQWVLAVGNPLGFSNTVSAGVVSSLKRDLPVGEAGLVNAIQTDAAINPGNSGGALCDAQGRLIGINSAIASGNGGSVGLGFAIPVERVKTVVDSIVKNGRVDYAGLGIERYPDDNALANPENRQEIAQRTNADNVPEKGVLVTRALNASAGRTFQPLDIITGIDGKPVSRFFDLNKALLDRKPGDHVKVTLWSKGQKKTVDVTLQDLQPQRSL